MALFMNCVCYRVEVCDSTRFPEAPLIPQTFQKPFVIPHAPAQFLSPVGMWTKVLDVELPAPIPSPWRSFGMRRPLA